VGAKAVPKWLDVILIGLIVGRRSKGLRYPISKIEQSKVERGSTGGGVATKGEDRSALSVSHTRFRHWPPSNWRARGDALLADIHAAN